MRLSSGRDHRCERCGDPEPLPIGHYCWDEKRARAVILRALHASDTTHSWDTDDYTAMADDILRRLAGDDLIPGRFDRSRRSP